MPVQASRHVADGPATGDVELACLIHPLARPFIGSGALVPLAVAGAKPMPQFPAMPTLIATGFPNLAGGQWRGLFAPTSTPLALAAAVQKALAVTIRLPDIPARLQAEGATPAGSTPAAFGAFVAAELAWLGDLVRGRGLHVRIGGGSARDRHRRCRLFQAIAIGATYLHRHLAAAPACK